mmetsp:Transcript_113863/g.232971  ORF Transcript_113863/g.232971 Transcript_113863/m.232971 type:complete len:243 (+) Transcript_113863:2450-3178(+)
MLAVVNGVVATALVVAASAAALASGVKDVVPQFGIHPLQLGPAEFQRVVDHAPEPDQIVGSRQILFRPEPVEEKDQLEGPAAGIDGQQHIGVATEEAQDALRQVPAGPGGQRGDHQCFLFVVCSFVVADDVSAGGVQAVDQRKGRSPGTRDQDVRARPVLEEGAGIEVEFLGDVVGISRDHHGGLVTEALEPVKGATDDVSRPVGRHRQAGGRGIAVVGQGQGQRLGILDGPQHGDRPVHFL